MNALRDHLPPHALDNPVHGLSAYRDMRKRTGMPGWNSKCVEVKYLLDKWPGLNDAQAAAMLGCSPKTVKKWRLWWIEQDLRLAKPGLVQPLDKALPEQETREGEVRTAVDPSRVSELRDEIETAYDLMTILDKAGDGIGGDVGYGVSAVVLAARAALDNARSMLRGVDDASTPANASRVSRATRALGATHACACEGGAGGADICRPSDFAQEVA